MTEPPPIQGPTLPEAASTMTSRAALLSVVCGIAPFVIVAMELTRSRSSTAPWVVALFANVLAIGLSIRGIAQTSDPEVSGRGLAVLGLILGFTPWIVMIFGVAWLASTDYGEHS